MAFIDQYRTRFGVEPICRVLRERNVGIAPSTYYAYKSRPPSARTQRDAWLIEQIRQAHQDNYGVYGASKVWAQLNRQGTPVARCTVQRLMRHAGLRGVTRGQRKIRTTLTGAGTDYPVDLVERDFTASAPDRLWVADLTYIRTRAGWVYPSVHHRCLLKVHSRLANRHHPPRQSGHRRSGNGSRYPPAQKP